MPRPVTIKPRLVKNAVSSSMVLVITRLNNVVITGWQPSIIKEELSRLRPTNNTTKATNDLSLPPGLGYAFTFEGSVIPENLPSHEWVMDSGATSHFTYNKYDYLNYTPCTDR